MLKLPVSARTVRRHLSSTTYLKYEKCNKAPMMKTLHKENRLEWAKEMVSYGDKWDKVVFLTKRNSTLMSCSTIVTTCERKRKHISVVKAEVVQ